MVKAGDKTLESYLYAPNNGPLITVAYGNGDTQEILYDKEERIRARRWNGESTDAVRYEYDDYGTLEKETDLVNGRIDKDQYDMTGRLVQSTTLEKNTGAAGEPTVANTHTVQSLEIGYDSYNRVNRLVQSLEGSKTKTGLVYGDASKTQRPGLSYGLTVDGTQRQSLAYDAMARCTKETVTLPGGQKRENCFTYGTLRHLTDTDRDLFTYRTDGWRDQLLSWNGKSYAYDAGGNPTVLRGMALTWGEGRRLKRIAATAGAVTFAYDSDGKRVRKTSGENTTTYYYNGNVLSGLVRRAAGSTGVGTTVQFVYDTQGKPFMLRLNGKTDYFYLYNGLGDVTGLVDSSNQVVVRYQYNSWGKVTSTQDTSGVSLATLNPFRYRKYVHDPETGLYCLGSRYYDPEVGRFVNADDPSTIFAKPQELYSKNLYVYCDNNPIIRKDVQGYFPIPCIVGAVVGAVVSGFSYVLSSGGEIDGVELAKSCLVGAVSGALAPLEPVRSIKKGYLAVASVINGINTAINTDGDIPTRIVCGIIEGCATMASGYICNKWTGDVELTTKASQVIANAAVGYTVGQTAELAAIGLSAATNSGANASKKTNSATSNARTTKQSNTRVITTVSGRKKVINKVKKPARRNTKFWRVCMA
ncbi:MAG: RHS repeat domain-containing protein [Lachnospiraceae bacterium]